METQLITRKFTLYPQGGKEEVDRVYKYIRNGQEVQAQMMNLCASALYTARQNNMPKEEYKELSKSYGQIPSEKNKETSAYYGLIDMDKIPKGIALAGSIPRAVNQKLDKAYKDGLKYGRVSLPSFRASAPMYVQRPLLLTPADPDRSPSSQSGLFHEYASVEEFEKELKNGDEPKVGIHFCNKITFSVVFGNPRKSAELRSIMQKLFSGEYRICDSSIGIDDKKIILYMSIKKPCNERKLDENTCVGVDLGVAVPAVCALNNNIYKRAYIGSYDEMIAFKTKKKAMYNRIQEQTKNRGGHGRKRKLAKQYTYENYISNYAKTYNHKIAKQIVDYAVKNNAKYIHLEDLAGIKERSDTFLLQNWSLYDLQNDIIYKAKLEGIEVRFVKAAYTSQTCSVCGKRGIRSDQKTFMCTNPACKMEEIYKDFGKRHFADFNAARNIAMKTEFVQRGENSSKTRAGKMKKRAEALKTSA